MEYFKKHKEYTHFVICPDDLVINSNSFNLLCRDIEEHDFSNICGISNIDEERPDYYCCKPLGLNPKTKGRNFTKEDKDELTDSIVQVGFTGYSCQFLERDLVEQLSFTGACNKDQGCLDLQMALEMSELKLPMMVDFNADFWHMRTHSRKQAYDWVKGTHHPDEGYIKIIHKDAVYHDSKTYG